jgi:flagellar biosynthesis/type III secretory pathway chaperone
VKDILAGMLEVLQEQARVYNAIRSLAEKKQERLLERDIPGLEKLVLAEEMLILESGRLEERRQTLSGPLAEGLTLCPDATLEDMCQAAGEPYAGDLRAISREISTVLKDVSELNSLNQELIEASLTYVNYSLGILTGDDSGTPVYGETGFGRRSTDQSRVLDRRC